MVTEEPEIMLEGNVLSIRQDVYEKYEREGNKLGITVDELIRFSFVLMAYHMTHESKYLEDPLIHAHPRLREILLRG
jgi:hypothetical protein